VCLVVAVTYEEIKNCHISGKQCSSLPFENFSFFCHPGRRQICSVCQLKCKCNADCPTLTRNEQWPAAWQQARWQGFHSFTCHPRIYPQMEWAILHPFRKHSPDCVARARWRTSGSPYYSSIDLERMKGWVGLVGWRYSGWFTHISCHPSATGRAWDKKVRQRQSETGVLPLCNAARSWLTNMLLILCGY